MTFVGGFVWFVDVLVIFYNDFPLHISHISPFVAPTRLALRALGIQLHNSVVLNACRPLRNRNN